IRGDRDSRSGSSHRRGCCRPTDRRRRALRGRCDMSETSTTVVPWQRLIVRVVWVDIAVSILSLLPGVIAIWFFGAEASPGELWPVVVIAAIGVVGAIGDIVRWAFTTYRVTGTDIERRTGLFGRGTVPCVATECAASTRPPSCGTGSPASAWP